MNALLLSYNGGGRGVILLIEALSQIKDKIGMDSNYFYPLLVTIIISLIPLIKSFFSFICNTRIDNLLDLHGKEETDFFYVIIMMIEMFFFFVSLFLAVFVCAVIGILFLYVHVNLQMKIAYLLISFFSLSIGLIITNITLMKFMFVRKRIIGEKNSRWLIYAPITLYNLLLFFLLVFPQLTFLAILNVMLIVLFEIVGTIHFRGRYIKYEYSSLRIYTNTGDTIECEDISKITRRSDILIINTKNTKIHVNYKNISKIEYKGEELVMLKKSFWRG